MPTVLVSNDDGIDSPTLVPLARSLQTLGEVRVVVPSTERSWIGKAITRFEPVRVEATEREGIAMHAVAGSPADCVNLGVHTLFPDPPDLVVSGINLGLNFGLAFVLSSGTVGAALEAWIAGIPSFAFSTAIPGDAFGLSGAERAAALGRRAIAAAEVSADVVGTVLRHGFPPHVDCFSVNLPADVDAATPRSVARVTRSRYGGLFEPRGNGSYAHRLRALWPLETPADGDMQLLERGVVAISPLRMEFFAGLPDPLRAALENSGTEPSNR